MEATSERKPNANEFNFKVHCPVERPLLNILRRFVSNVAEEMGFDHDDVCKIEMAVDEACTNAFLHAYRERQPAPPPAGAIELKLIMSPEGLTIQIQDFGDRAARTPPVGEASIREYQKPGRDRYRGLGILIMKEFMDDVHFADQPERGTLVTLRKFLRDRDRLGPATSPAMPNGRK